MKGIKGLIFDYGGTLDTAGCHWGKVIWHAYEKHGVPVSEENFRKAYVHAERTLGKNRIIMPDYTFHKTLEVKLEIEINYLREEGLWEVSEQEACKTRSMILDTLYDGVKAETAHSRNVLQAISTRYPMVLVSNFYGNIGIVLQEFRFDGLFDDILESATIGIRKPDPAIFSLGVKSLNINPEETVVVGDSFDKDIIPAKKAGCKAVWFKGEGWTDTEHDENIPDKIITRLEELDNFL